MLIKKTEVTFAETKARGIISIANPSGRDQITMFMGRRSKIQCA